MNNNGRVWTNVPSSGKEAGSQTLEGCTAVCVHICVVIACGGPWLSLGSLGLGPVMTC